jgi:hypothetical protein
MFGAPGLLKSGGFAGTKQVITLVQQDCRSLVIVKGDFEEIRIERYDLERKVGSRVCVVMANLF